MSLEQFLNNITIEELEELKELKELQNNTIQTYSFSSIKYEELETLVSIEENINKQDIFSTWLENDLKISNDIVKFLEYLIKRNIKLIKFYHEEDLKVNFIMPLVNKIDFFLLDDNIRSFTDEKLIYKTEKFIFNGEADFIFSKGIKKAERPYFFIQEFKQGKTARDPEPQLLAELISAIELNSEISMRGAYIVGAIWNFVILEKLSHDKYQYFVSQNYDCTKIEDLKDIYKNLLFVKNEVIQMCT
ncbi:MAG: hypothetical protein U9P38_08895 [Campylobacterota bacterium]|nr:hypothetical protein [Campylobacterota bacterium]